MSSSAMNHSGKVAILSFYAISVLTNLGHIFVRCTGSVRFCRPRNSTKHELTKLLSLGLSLVWLRRPFGIILFLKIFSERLRYGLSQRSLVGVLPMRALCKWAVCGSSTRHGADLSVVVCFAASTSSTQINISRCLATPCMRQRGSCCDTSILQNMSEPWSFQSCQQYSISLCCRITIRGSKILYMLSSSEATGLINTSRIKNIDPLQRQPSYVLAYYWTIY